MFKQNVEDKTDKQYNLGDVNNEFKLPIHFNANNQKLNESVLCDLELIKPINETEQPIYHYIFKPNNMLSKITLESIATTYTTDVNYLEDTQKLMNNLDNSKIENTIHDKKLDQIVTNWSEIHDETSFCEKYLFINFDFAKFINNNETFLQIMSVYNIASPILSLFLPILILIVPFFIIKFRGDVELNMNEYITVLKKIISNHAISKVFTKFNEVDFGQKIYLLISTAFYIFSIYQNILICVRFYSNMKKIHDYLAIFKQYIDDTLCSINYYLSITDKLTTYNEFNVELKNNMNVLLHFRDCLDKITPFKITLPKITQIGHIMHTFYQIYDNEDFNKALLYSFGFNGYLSNLYGLKSNILNGTINATTFMSDTKPKFKQMYYPKLIDDVNVIKNECDLTKNIILTGPNASGKTTTLKSTLINIIVEIVYFKQKLDVVKKL